MGDLSEWVGVTPVNDGRKEGRLGRKCLRLMCSVLFFRDLFESERVSESMSRGEGEREKQTPH